MFSTQQQGHQWMRQSPAPTRGLPGRQPFPPRPGNPMPFGGPNQGPSQGGGGIQGFIKKLFGGGASSPGPMGPGVGPASFGQSAGASGMSGMLGNAQEILKFAKTAAPYIKEYGPMVKNLPAMIEMVKALNSDDLDDEETDEELDELDADLEEDTLEEDEEKVVKKRTKRKRENLDMSKVESSQDALNGTSKPKLFI
ncbi:YqfQ family protein [Radiobacillus kanasensis]|uniref:YqfQ family protein n=1 Tax=Radiobacillus kanasensis TaxID=2844358 RepID=UPI001E51826F|nr:YqfQ family protein [Radiobacillus kanasensis]UFU01238.1 YqfQ family protein [Radiobacillus kanasensis]